MTPFMDDSVTCEACGAGITLPNRMTRAKRATVVVGYGWSATADGEHAWCPLCAEQPGTRTHSGAS